MPRPKLYPYSLLAARTAVVGKRGEESGMRSVIMGQGRMICLIAIRLHPPVTTTSRIGLPKGRSEAPGHLISTSLEAMRQVRGQLDELCDVFSPGWLQGLTQSAEVNATFAVSPAKPPDFVAVGPGRPLAELNAKRTGSSVHRVRQQGGPQHHLLEGDLHHARQVHEPLGQEGILLYEVAPGASAEMSASLPARVCIAPESIRYSAPKCNN